MSSQQDLHSGQQSENSQANHRNNQYRRGYNQNNQGGRNSRNQNQQHRSTGPNAASEFHPNPTGQSNQKRNNHHSYNPHYNNSKKSNIPNFSPTSIDSSSGDQTPNDFKPESQKSNESSENGIAVTSFSPSPISRISPASIVTKQSHNQKSSKADQPQLQPQIDSPQIDKQPPVQPQSTQNFTPEPSEFKPIQNNSTTTSQTNQEETKIAAPPKPEVQCPICSDKRFNFFSEVVFHIIKNHKLRSVMNSIVDSNYKCNFCDRLLNEDDEIAVQHMFDHHRKELFDAIRANKSKKDPRLNGFLKKVLNIEEKSRELFKKINEDFSNDDEEEDLDYANFIASTIQTKGVMASENVVIDDIQEVTTQGTQLRLQKIDHDFWTALNTLDQKLHESGSIVTIEDDCSCNICHKHFSSYVKLLAHCWGEHDQILQK